MEYLIFGWFFCCFGRNAVFRFIEEITNSEIINLRWSDFFGVEFWEAGFLGRLVPTCGKSISVSYDRLIFFFDNLHENMQGYDIFQVKLPISHHLTHHVKRKRNFFFLCTLLMMWCINNISCRLCFSNVNKHRPVTPEAAKHKKQTVFINKCDITSIGIGSRLSSPSQNIGIFAKSTQPYVTHFCNVWHKIFF